MHESPQQTRTRAYYYDLRYYGLTGNNAHLVYKGIQFHVIKWSRILTIKLDSSAPLFSLEAPKSSVFPSGRMIATTHYSTFAFQYVPSCFDFNLRRYHSILLLAIISEILGTLSTYCATCWRVWSTTVFVAILIDYRQFVHTSNHLDYLTQARFSRILVGVATVAAAKSAEMRMKKRIVFFYREWKQMFELFRLKLSDSLE